MKKLKWSEYCNEYEKNQQYLRNLIKRMYKTPGYSVSDNTIHMIEKELNEKNKISINDVTITVKSEEIEVIYKCDDEEELKEIKKLHDVKSINDLEVIISNTMNTYEVTFNSILAEVFTSNEAAELYEITEGTLRSAMKSGKLRFGTDYRKSGRITLISRSAMDREYSK